MDMQDLKREIYFAKGISKSVTIKTTVESNPR